jgi:ubiquinone/menaquinone biosynthesis C-methylase UbiE
MDELDIEVWGRIAEAWERHADVIFENSRPVSEWMVNALDPRPGQTILELAAGPGDTGFLAARRIGDTGKLICSDFAPQMVEIARRRGGTQGITNVDFQVIDAQAVELPDDSVDGVLCRFGFMLLPEPNRALREARRVMKPQGRLAFATWAAPEKNMWLSLLALSMMQRGLVPPGDPFGAGGVFSMSDLKRVEELIMGAGFHHAHVGEVAVPHRFASFTEYWTLQSEIAGPLAEMLKDLPEGQRDLVRATVEESTRMFSTGEGLEMPGVAVAAVAY